MRIVRNRDYGQNPVGMIKTIIPLTSQLGRIGRFILHQPSQWKMTRISLDFITNTIWKDLEIVYPTSEDSIPAPSTPSKKNKKK